MRQLTGGYVARENNAKARRPALHGAHVTRVVGHVTRVMGHVTRVVGHVTRVVGHVTATRADEAT
eukprot:7179813-Prymnesium_polylepis.1